MKLRSSKIYGLDLEVMSRSFAHDVTPLKDSHDVELTNQNKSITDGNERCESVWGYKTNGCTAEIPATC